MHTVPMRTSSGKMDAILANMTPMEFPEFRRAIDLFELCAVISQEEAEEWRMRFHGWVGFRFGLDEPETVTGCRDS